MKRANFRFEALKGAKMNTGIRMERFAPCTPFQMQMEHMCAGGRQ